MSLSPLQLAASSGKISLIKKLSTDVSQLDLDEIHCGGPLHFAAAAGSEEGVRILVQAKANVNQKNFMGLTPLHFAVFGGNLEVIKLLAASGAKLQALSNTMDTPLHNAASLGSISVTQTLVELGASLFAPPNVDGQNIVDCVWKENFFLRDFIREQETHHLAVSERLFEMISTNRVTQIEPMLKKNASVHFSKEGTTMLQRACLNGNVHVAKSLISWGSPVERVTAENGTALHCACASGIEACFDLILDNAEAPEILFLQVVPKTNETLLHSAVLSRDLRMVERILDGSAALTRVADRQGNTPLHLAASLGHLDAANLLLQFESDPSARNGEGHTPLSLAESKKHEKVATFLKHKMGISTKLEQDLFAAIAANDKDSIRSLVILKANLVSHDESGLSPLAKASLENRFEIVELLLSLKSDVNQIGPSHTSPLHEACGAAATKAVDALLAAKADVNLPSSDQLTPLHFAIFGGSEPLVQKIIQARAFLDPTTHTGDTPLHICAQKGHIGMTEMLIGAGALVFQRNHAGKTPADLAGENGNGFVIGMFSAHHAIALDTLFRALKSGSSTALSTALQRHPPLDETQNGNSVLMLAAAKGDADATSLLLEAEADVDLKRSDGYTALTLAVKNGHSYCVRLLLHAHASTSFLTEPDSLSALHLAAISGFDQVITSLVNHSSEMDIDALQGARGNSALHLAVASGSLPACAALIAAGCNLELMNASGEYAIDVAHSKKLHPILKNLEDAMARAGDSTASAALFSAMKNHDADSIERLLAQGASANSIQKATGLTLIRVAAERTDEQFVRLLLRHDADVNICCGADGQNAIHAAARLGAQSIFSLVSKVGDILIAAENEAASPTLYYALVGGNPSIITSVISRAPDVDAPDKLGNSALHHAAAVASPESCARLLRAKATVDIANAKGETAIEIALRLRRLDVAAALDLKSLDGPTRELFGAIRVQDMGRVKAAMRSGASVTETNTQHMDSLMLACSLGFVVVAQHLIDAKADVNNRGTRRHALLEAALSGSVDCVKLLLHNQASPSVASKDGKTAIHIAASRGNTDMIRLLNEFAATSFRTSSGNTALHESALTGCLTSARLLVSLGIDRTVRNKNGHTALDVALSHSDGTVVAEFLSQLEEKEVMIRSTVVGPILQNIVTKIVQKIDPKSVSTPRKSVAANKGGLRRHPSAAQIATSPDGKQMKGTTAFLRRQNSVMAVVDPAPSSPTQLKNSPKFSRQSSSEAMSNSPRSPARSPAPLKRGMTSALLAPSPNSAEKSRGLARQASSNAIRGNPPKSPPPSSSKVSHQEFSSSPRVGDVAKENVEPETVSTAAAPIEVSSPIINAPSEELVTPVSPPPISAASPPTLPVTPVIIPDAIHPPINHQTDLAPVVASPPPKTRSSRVAEIRENVTAIVREIVGRVSSKFPAVAKIEKKGAVEQKKVATAPADRRNFGARERKTVVSPTKPSSVSPTKVANRSVSPSKGVVVPVAPKVETAGDPKKGVRSPEPKRPISQPKAGPDTSSPMSPALMTPTRAFGKKEPRQEFEPTIKKEVSPSRPAPTVPAESSRTNTSPQNSKSPSSRSPVEKLSRISPTPAAASPPKVATRASPTPKRDISEQLRVFAIKAAVGEVVRQIVSNVLVSLKPRLDLNQKKPQEIPVTAMRREDLEDETSQLLDAPDDENLDYLVDEIDSFLNKLKSAEETAAKKGKHARFSEHSSEPRLLPPKKIATTKQTPKKEGEIKKAVTRLSPLRGEAPVSGGATDEQRRIKKGPSWHSCRRPAACPICNLSSRQPEKDQQPLVQLLDPLRFSRPPMPLPITPHILPPRPASVADLRPSQTSRPGEKPVSVSDLQKTFGFTFDPNPSLGDEWDLNDKAWISECNCVWPKTCSQCRRVPADQRRLFEALVSQERSEFEINSKISPLTHTSADHRLSEENSFFLRDKAPRRASAEYGKGGGKTEWSQCGCSWPKTCPACRDGIRNMFKKIPTVRKNMSDTACQCTFPNTCAFCRAFRPKSATANHRAFPPAMLGQVATAPDSTDVSEVLKRVMRKQLGLPPRPATSASLDRRPSSTNRRSRSAMDGRDFDTGLLAPIDQMGLAALLVRLGFSDEKSDNLARRAIAEYKCKTIGQLLDLDLETLATIGFDTYDDWEKLERLRREMARHAAAVESAGPQSVVRENTKEWVDRHRSAVASESKKESVRPDIPRWK